MREETKVVVNVLDFTPMMEQIKRRYIEQNPDNKDNISFILREKWGFVNTKKGKIMICNEGVVSSQAISEKYPFELPVYKEKKTDKGEYLGILPEYMLNMKDPKDIEELPVVGQEKLETFIRTFGRRLESNFWICKKFLEKIII